MKQEETAILSIADLHVGKETETYNRDVFIERMDGLVNKILRIRELLSDYDFDRLAIFGLGDFNDGTGIFPGQGNYQDITDPYKQADFLADYLTEWTRKLRQTWGVVSWDLVPGNHGRCHDEETELLTVHGWKDNAEIDEGDLVATYNLHTGRMEWQPLLHVHRENYDGPMWHLSDRENDFMVSPDHRMVVMPKTGSPSCYMATMQNLMGDFRTHRYVPKVADTQFTDTEGITDDELRLVGWLITDGCYKKSGNHTAVNIYQSKEDGIAKIRELLNRLGYAYSQRVRVRAGRYEVNGVPLKSVRDAYEFYIKAESTPRILALLPDKHSLPGWTWGLSKRQVNVLLDALLDGDGSRWKRNSRCLYGQKEILDQVQALLTSVGIVSHLCHNKRGFYLGIGADNGKAPVVELKRKNIEEVQYQGVIWCGTVENGTLITRRNGCTLVSGNSGKFAAEAANWDRVCFNFLKKNLKDDQSTAVSFNDSGDVFLRKVEIRGHNHLLYHGHDIRMYQSIPLYGINNRLLRWNSCSSIKPFDVSWMGHFHTASFSVLNTINSMLTGCMPTDDPWSIRTLGYEGVNQWWLCGCSDTRPLTFKYSLELV